ncbi:MAG: hypothetical protein CBB90_02040, partial [Gammaproteobacteria bacterium TMED30]
LDELGAWLTWLGSVTSAMLSIAAVVWVELSVWLLLSQPARPIKAVTIATREMRAFFIMIPLG